MVYKVPINYASQNIKDTQTQQQHIESGQLAYDRVNPRLLNLEGQN